MPDILGWHPETGDPVAVPQEAAAEAYRSKKLAFKKGERVPVTVRGVEGTLPSEDVDAALAAGETELNFDPHGAVKAGIAGGLRGLTLGASDWLAVEGQKLVDPEGAEKTRQSLDALQKEHGVASALGEIGGAIVPSLVPGGAEAELTRAGAVGGREAVAASHAIGEAGEGLATTQALSETAQQAKALADAHAASGVTKGSLLARTLRAVNPYEYVGKAGAATESALGRVLGESRAARATSALAKWGVEGSIVGVANAADEAELGDTNLTGETILANVEHGALWGSALGLVGTGAARIMTGAGRMANRLAEAQLGGSPLEMRRALKKYGPGALGYRMLEEGYSPFMDAEKQYEWARSMNERDGASLGRVVKDADSRYEGAAAKEVRASALNNMEATLQQYAAAGGNPDRMRQVLKDEIERGIGWKTEPEPPPPVPARAIDETYEAAWKEAGLPDPSSLKKPKYPSNEKIEQRARVLVQQSGAGRPVTPQEVGERIQQIIAEARANRTPLKADQLDANNIRKALKLERKAAVDKVYDQAKAEMLTSYGRDLHEFEKVNTAHNDLRNQVAAEINEQAAARERTYHRLVEATQKYNEELKVGFEQVRAVRQRIDKVIPWSYAHNADAVANAAVELKLAARSALEGKVEESLDKAARAAGDEQVLGNYLHAKQRYAESKDIARMAERGRARHAGLFGRPSRVGGISAHVALGATEVLTGHPLAGAALGLGGGIARHYGPKVAAWALHKATRLAQLKALRQEVQIATRRGVRGGMGQGLKKTTEPTYFRVQPVGKDIFGHTSAVASTPVKDGHLMVFKDPKQLFETYTWNHVQKKLGDYEMVELTGHSEYQPEDTEGVAVIPKALVRRTPMAEWAKNPTAKQEPGVTAQVAIDNLPPHQLRQTAAQAMEQVARLANNPAELRSRLAALDPSLPIVAPESFAAAENGFRRQVGWLLQQIPSKLLSKHQMSGDGINPRDLSDAEARDFLEHASVTVDPRVATDALAAGNVTANQVKAYKAVWPAIRGNAVLQYKRMQAMDREGFDFMPHAKKGHLEAMFGDDDPGFTLALQANAAALLAQPQPQGGKGGPRGMSHAAATSKGMSASLALMNTQAQTAESGPPGRRGRSGRSAENGL